jgi:hypothetical protein
MTALINKTGGHTDNKQTDLVCMNQQKKKKEKKINWSVPILAKEHVTTASVLWVPGRGTSP